jgi:uncharacterized membrane protein
MSTPGPINNGTSTSFRLSRKIGAITAVLSTVFGVLYLLGLGVNLTTSGSVYPSGSDVKAVSAGIALLWNLALVTMFTALRREARHDRAILSEVALVFAILVCGASSASWFAGMTVFPRLSDTLDPGLAALFDPYHPGSFPYSLEHLAWGLFFGIATILAAVAFEAATTSRWLRASLMLTGLLSLAHFVGVVSTSPLLTSFGYVSWGVTLPVASAFLAVMFRHKLAKGT